MVESGFDEWARKNNVNPGDKDFHKFSLCWWEAWMACQTWAFELQERYNRRKLEGK